MSNSEMKLHEDVASTINEAKQTFTEDPYRMRFHITPPVGLLNDPNGLVYFKGKYHVFYQWNPFEMEHGRKYWGHMTSEDLMNWEEQEYALAPAEWYEKDGCYSGSAIVHDSKLYILYTGNVKDPGGNRETFQCLAVSKDGIHFEKKGPVIHLPSVYTSHFRDPKVWKEDGLFYTIVGAQTKALKGAAALFMSTDLYDWKHIGPLKTDFDDFGYMWECPDLFKLDGKDVFLFSPQGLEKEPFKYQNIYQSGYSLGEIELESAVFRHGDFHELDYGLDFYAPQTFQDHKGRRLLMAWMGTADPGVNHPSKDAGWIHALSMPRELIRVGDEIWQIPLEEIKSLRQSTITDDRLQLNGNPYTIHGICAEVSMKDISIEGKALSVLIRDNLTFSYDKEKKTACLTRSGYEPEKRYCLLDHLESIQIFMDTSSVEIFLNDGKKTFSARYFPHPKETSILLDAEGPVSFQLKAWNLL